MGVAGGGRLLRVGCLWGGCLWGGVGVTRGRGAAWDSFRVIVTHDAGSCVRVSFRVGVLRARPGSCAGLFPGSCYARRGELREGLFQAWSCYARGRGAARGGYVCPDIVIGLTIERVGLLGRNAS
jgi:hypothetical protein